MDDYSMKVQATVELPSAKKVDDQIRALEKSISKLKISGKFDDTALKSLTNQLNTLKATITTAAFSPAALKDLTNQVQSALSNINISGINIGNGSNDAKQIGQQIGTQISQGISHGIKDNTSVLKSFKESLGNIGMSSKEINVIASRIEKLRIKIESLNQSNSSGKNGLLSVDISGIDEYGQAIKLTQKYNSATGELLKTIDAVSTVQQKAGAATDSFIEKQQKAVAAAKNSLSTIESKLHDKGANKTLANTDFNANGLNNQLDVIRKAIVTLENANKKTFTQAQIDVNKEINALNNLITTLKNAEYAATSLRTKDINTVKIDEGNKLDAFVQKMEQSGHYTDDLKNKAEQLKSDLSNMFDINGLTNYLNNVSNLQSEFQKVDASAKTVEKSTKLKTNIDSEKRILQVYTTELKDAGVLTGDVKLKIQEMFHSLSKVDSQTGLTTWRAELKGVKAETDAVLKSVTQLSQKKINEIQLSMEGKNKKSQNYDYQIDTEIKKLKDLGFTDEEVAQKVKILTEAQAELKRVMDSSDFDSIASKNKAIIESDKERTTALNQVRTAYGQLKNDASQYYNLNKQSKLSTDIQNWLSKNSRASKDAKESLNAYYRELSGGRVSVDRLNYIEKELKDIDATQRGLGKLGKNLKDQFKEAGASFTQWLSVSSGIMALVYQLQKIPKEVIAVNKAMVELTKVSDASSSDITKYFDEAANSAKRYGTAVSDMINATADWSRLGYNLPDSKKLAEIATLYTNVGDGIDMNTANEHLISTLQGFQLEAEDAIGIIDRFNEVANNFPIDTAGIGEALQRSAASFYAANTDLSKSIALITGTNSVVQDPDSVGRVLPTFIAI